MPAFPEIASRLDAPLADVMRAQAPTHRLRSDPVDDDTVLALLGLASSARAERRRRCEFIVVRDPDIRHQLARAYRQGWSIYRRVLRSRSHEDALLEARQWEADHFEDVPVAIVACVRGRRPIAPAIGAASFYLTAFSAVQNLLLAAEALGLGAVSTTLPLWNPRAPRPRDPCGSGADRLAERHREPAAPAAGRQSRPPRPLGPSALPDGLGADISGSGEHGKLTREEVAPARRAA